MSNLAKDFFNQHDLACDKCKALAQDHAVALDWENHNASDLSPGIVKNEEKLARQIHSPIHVDHGKNEIKVTAFNDAFDKGMSTNRLHYINGQDLHQIGESKAENDRIRDPSREYIGYIETTAESIRRIVDENTTSRVFGVYDTAIPEAVHHADICLIRPENPDDVKLPKKAIKR